METLNHPFPAQVPVRELAASEVWLRTVFGMRTRPALQFLSLDSDGGDDASRLRHAVEKGGVLYDAYRRYSTSFFSAFGSAFDHLRKVRSAKIREGTYGGTKCKEKDVKVCPVDAAAPDGVHARAAYDGFDATDHGGWPRFVGGGLFDKRGKALSHLGHEVIGNQLAYHYLQYANTTLHRLLRSDDPARDRVDINRRLGRVEPNFKMLDLRQIRAVVADLWTSGPLWSRTRSLDESITNYDSKCATLDE